MSDNTPNGDHDTESVEPQGEAAPEANPAPPQGDTTADTAAAVREAEKWKKRSRANEDQLKALREQVKQLVDPEQVATVESQLAATSQQLSQVQAEAARYKVALEVGLPPDLAARLVGTTEDELREDAKALKELVKSKPAGAVNAAKASGPTDGAAQPTDLNSLLRAAAGKGN